MARKLAIAFAVVSIAVLLVAYFVFSDPYLRQGRESMKYFERHVHIGMTAKDVRDVAREARAGWFPESPEEYRMAAYFDPELPEQPEDFSYRAFVGVGMVKSTYVDWWKLYSSKSYELRFDDSHTLVYIESELHLHAP